MIDCQKTVGRSTFHLRKAGISYGRTQKIGSVAVTEISQHFYSDFMCSQYAVPLSAVFILSIILPAELPERSC